MEKNTDLSLGRNEQKSVTILQNYRKNELGQLDEKGKTAKETLLQKQLALVKIMARLTGSGVTVFDLHKQVHIYTSQNFYKIFGYENLKTTHVGNEVFDSKVHPEDLKDLSRNGAAAMKFLSELPVQKRKQYKMVNEYRILSPGGSYMQVIEQHQLLENDQNGNPWLSLAVIDISPNQYWQDHVNFQILNYITGEFVQLQTNSETKKIHLTTREREILRLVKDGKLSKEISYLLEISVHTVNTHRQRILEKLEANNAIEAVSTADKLNLLT
jgi:DNA-binding CsgD family transcriptional regulator